MANINATNIEPRQRRRKSGMQRSTNALKETCYALPTASPDKKPSHQEPEAVDPPQLVN
jgi:hypothetical protein